MTDGDLTPPPPATATAASPRTSRKGLWIGLAAGAVVLAFLLGAGVGTIGGIAIASGANAKPVATPAAAAATDDAYGTLASDEPSETPSDEPFEYSEGLFTIELKTLSKECFGSAGCNIVVKPEFTTFDPASIPDDATGSITYEITGGTDGSVLETTQLTGSSYSQEQSVIQVPNRGTKLKVKITDTETYQ